MKPDEVRAGATPRRLTPAEADALVADFTPAERRRKINTLLEALAIRGITVREFFDAAGRSYIVADADQVREASPELAAFFEEIAAESPLPQVRTPPAA
jgi:hypothetical protein